jgi:PEP-CTERM motif-containing protein
MKTPTKYLLAALTIISFATVARAQTSSDTLQHLVDTNGSLVIDDKIFSNFAFSDSGLTNFDASEIQVTASFQGGIYYLTWGGNISLVSSSSATADLLLNYTVTATAGVINTIDQLYTGSAQPNRGAFLSVDETVRDSQGNLVANSHLQGDDLSDPFAEPGDNLSIDPAQSVLHVTKDIGLGISNDGGFVTISEVRQSFHQNQIPEPASAVLFGTGLAGLAIVGLRRRRS